MSEPERATIIFYRLGGWQDRLRSYEILVDKKPVGTLAAKSELTVHVRPGRRIMKARIGGQGSDTISYNFANGGRYRVHVGPSPGLAFRKLFEADSWVIMAVDEAENVGGQG